MVLTDKDIRDVLREKPDFISPFNEERLQASTYDVAISSAITTLEPIPVVVDLLDEDRIQTLYANVDISENGYILKPGQLVFATLKERISLPDDMVAQILPRTRYTRIGILVHDQFCNPSYEGNLPIVIQNASPNNVLIVEGLAIAQVMFIRLADKPTESKLYRNNREALFQNEREFIGSKFDENNLSAGARDLYKKIMSNLQG